MHCAYGQFSKAFLKVAAAAQRINCKKVFREQLQSDFIHVKQMYGIWFQNYKTSIRLSIYQLLIPKVHYSDFLIPILHFLIQIFKWYYKNAIIELYKYTNIQILLYKYILFTSILLWHYFILPCFSVFVSRTLLSFPLIKKCNWRGKIKDYGENTQVQLIAQMNSDSRLNWLWRNSAFYCRMC